MSVKIYQPIFNILFKTQYVIIHRRVRNLCGTRGRFMEHIFPRGGGGVSESRDWLVMPEMGSNCEVAGEAWFSPHSQSAAHLLFCCLVPNRPWTMGPLV